MRLKYLLGFSFIIISIFFQSCGPSQEELRIAQEKAEMAQEKAEIAQEKTRQEVIKRQKKEQVRLDGLNSNISHAEIEINKKRVSKAILYLDTALSFANANEKNDLILNRASYYFKIRKYKDAIDDYSTLINANISTEKNYYERAVCYKKIRKYKEAVDDLRVAMDLGNTDAETLYEKINPERKRVAYYVTRCCDGTTSNATGRGACSHHGGVCDWNEPVYETYRKY